MPKLNASQILDQPKANESFYTTRKIADQTALIDELQIADAYPHSVAGPIVIHETHISWVILAGHFAYKIKKAVKTDFLDYSSLEKRHLACCAEIRLNSRFSEGLYLDVVPITFEDGQVRMDGDSHPIEFAVRMKRFPDNSLLSDRIQSQQLSVDEVINLATTISNFHSQADVIHRSIDEQLSDIRSQAIANFDSLFGEVKLDREHTLRSIAKWTEDIFEQHINDFRSRAQKGFIRECHGDLHCNNIALWNNHWVPFDGIEFNPSYSGIDVLNDIAFLIMDLQAQDRHDLASSFLNSYLEQSGDYESLTLLRWYIVYRALVRAKVAVMQIHQGDVLLESLEIHYQTARKYIDLANRILQSTNKRFWITHGVSGSGKTTGSHELVRNKEAIRLRSDVERKRIFKNASVTGASQSSEDMYSSTVTDATYGRLLTLAKQILDAGYSVVVDATFLKYSDRKRFATLASSEQIPFGILDFQAPEPELRRRLEQRKIAGNDVSDATISVLERQLKVQEPLTSNERSESDVEIFALK